MCLILFDEPLWELNLYGTLTSENIAHGKKRSYLKKSFCQLPPPPTKKRISLKKSQMEIDSRPVFSSTVAQNISPAIKEA